MTPLILLVCLRKEGFDAKSFVLMAPELDLHSVEVRDQDKNQRIRAKLVNGDDVEINIVLQSTAAASLMPKERVTPDILKLMGTAATRFLSQDFKHQVSPGLTIRDTGRVAMVRLSDQRKEDRATKQAEESSVLDRLMRAALSSPKWQGESAPGANHSWKGQSIPTIKVGDRKLFNATRLFTLNAKLPYLKGNWQRQEIFVLPGYNTVDVEYREVKLKGSPVLIDDNAWVDIELLDFIK